MTAVYMAKKKPSEMKLCEFQVPKQDAIQPSRKDDTHWIAFPADR